MTELDPENHIAVSFSCGITDNTEIEDQGDVIDLLIKIADRRLYNAKSGGRNLVISND